VTLGWRGRGRRTIEAVVLGVVVVATVLALGVRGSAAQSGANSLQYHLKPLAGSTSYLLFENYVVGQPRLTLHVLSASGVDSSLGAFTFGGTWSASLSGSTVAVGYEGDPTVEVWQLPSLQKHVVNAPPNTYFLAAAPGGYLAMDSPPRSNHGPYRLVRVSLTGHSTSLGTPYPKGGEPSVGVGSSWYVTFLQPKGYSDRIFSARFDRPGVFHVLQRGNGLDNLCGAPAESYVACWDPYKPYIRLFRMSGGRVAGTANDRYSLDVPLLAADSQGAFWLGSSDRLVQLHINGNVTTSRRQFASLAPVQAFHRIVVTSRSRHELLTVTSATAAPRVVVRVK
jgi:hypothetical protein